MSRQGNLWDTPNAIFLQALEVGHTLSDSQSGEESGYYGTRHEAQEDLYNGAWEAR